MIYLGTGLVRGDLTVDCVHLSMLRRVGLVRPVELSFPDDRAWRHGHSGLLPWLLLSHLLLLRRHLGPLSHLLLLRWHWPLLPRPHLRPDLTLLLLTLVVSKQEVQGWGARLLLLLGPWSSNRHPWLGHPIGHCHCN